MLPLRPYAPVFAPTKRPRPTEAVRPSRLESLQGDPVMALVDPEESGQSSDVFRRDETAGKALGNRHPGHFLLGRKRMVTVKFQRSLGSTLDGTRDRDVR